MENVGVPGRCVMVPASQTWSVNAVCAFEFSGLKLSELVQILLSNQTLKVSLSMFINLGKEKNNPIIHRKLIMWIFFMF